MRNPSSNTESLENEKEVLPEEGLQKSGAWWKHLLAGAAAGSVSRTVTAPLDRIKIYAQVYGKSVGPINGIKYMINEGGIFSLWRGNGVNLMKVAPESASKFLVYEEVKKALLAEGVAENLTIRERFIAGALAGVFAQTLVYPLDVIKTRRALVSKRKPQSAFQILRNGVRRYGWKFFIRGYFCNILGVFLFTGIDLAVYETVKKKFFCLNVKEVHIGHPCILLSAATSCIVAQLSTYPLSMLGTTIQAQDWNTESQMKACYLLVNSRLKENGLSGLYRGLTAALTKAVPALCITYFVYESTLTTLGTQMT